MRLAPYGANDFRGGDLGRPRMHVWRGGELQVSYRPRIRVLTLRLA